MGDNETRQLWEAVRDQGQQLASQHEMISGLRRELAMHQEGELKYRDRLEATLGGIRDTLSRANGGWAALVIAGTILTALTAGLGWLFVNWPHRGT